MIMQDRSREYCVMGGNKAPDDAKRSHPRTRRVRAVCPRCGKLVAMTVAGVFFPHWRFVGQVDEQHFP